jgi:hypothetical protein
MANVVTLQCPIKNAKIRPIILTSKTINNNKKLALCPWDGQFYKWKVFRKNFSAFQESGKLELFFKTVFICRG